MNKKVTIIDYGVGNILSIQNAIRFNGFDPIITSNPELIEKSSHIILPGVGAFPAAMEKLKKLNLIDPIQSFKKKGKFILGICLGMQLLFSRSEEFKKTEGLSLIEGDVAKLDKFDNYNNIKLPNIGWRKLDIELSNNKIELLSDIKKNSQFYFVHSYALKEFSKNVKIVNSSYVNIKFPAIVKENNTFGCQFHPEKSRENGLKLINNFLNL
jgi:glutamine amidotransferase